MSNIYVQEPSTYGTVRIITSLGELDIELWSKQTPMACRNFVQLCMQGFYTGLTFHRVIKNFLIQTGDPTGTGYQSVSIYGEPFKDEIHSRLRFNKRGIVALANGGKDDNGSQFFITLEPAETLEGKHTIFGKVTQKTMFNLLRFNDILVDSEGKPVYQQNILAVEVVVNPYNDIVIRSPPTERITLEEEILVIPKKTERGIKNFKLLSFGDEAEEDELEIIRQNKKYRNNKKSSHDVLNDPTLSKSTINDILEQNEGLSYNESNYTGVGRHSSKEKDKSEHIKERGRSEHSKDTYKSELRSIHERSDTLHRKRKSHQIKDEVIMLNLHTEDDNFSYENSIYRKLKKRKTEMKESVGHYKYEQEKFIELKQQSPTTGSSREKFTMSVLNIFKEKLTDKKEGENYDSATEEQETTKTSDWWNHSMQNKSERLTYNTSSKSGNRIETSQSSISNRRRTKNEDLSKKSYGDRM